MLRDEGEAYAKALEARGRARHAAPLRRADPRLLPLAGQGVGRAARGRRGRGAPCARGSRDPRRRRAHGGGPRRRRARRRRPARADPARARAGARRAGVAEARDAAADGLLQGPRRARRAQPGGRRPGRHRLGGQRGPRRRLGGDRARRAGDDRRARERLAGEGGGAAGAAGRARACTARATTRRRRTRSSLPGHLRLRLQRHARRRGRRDRRAGARGARRAADRRLRRRRRRARLRARALGGGAAGRAGRRPSRRSAPRRSPPRWPRARSREVEVEETLADGLAGNLEPGSVTFPLVRDHVAAVVGVDEPAIEDGIRFLARAHGLVAEGAGAVPAAALLPGRSSRARGRRCWSSPGATSRWTGWRGARNVNTGWVGRWVDRRGLDSAFAYIVRRKRNRAPPRSTRALPGRR